MKKMIFFTNLMLVYTSVFGMRNIEDNYNQQFSHQTQNWIQNHEMYNYNESEDSFYTRIRKKQKIMDKERENEGNLFNNYDYQKALDFFCEVCKFKNNLTMVWDNDEININRLPKVDFGKFDQRQKFIDMFENYDDRGISNEIQIDFSYGKAHHDMFISQPISYEYSTEKFLFQSNVVSGEEQPFDNQTCIKPYLSKKIKPEF